MYTKYICTNSCSLHGLVKTTWLCEQFTLVFNYLNNQRRVLVWCCETFKCWYSNFKKYLYYVLLIESLNHDDMVNHVVIVTYISNVMRKTLFRDRFHWCGTIKSKWHLNRIAKLGYGLISMTGENHRFNHYYIQLLI